MSNLIEIATWSGRRHWANADAPKAGDGQRTAICNGNTDGWAKGEEWSSVAYKFTPEARAAMPFCKLCARKGGDPA